MTTSSIVKRTAPLIAILVIIIAIAVSCTLISSDRDVPSISNGDQNFATYSVSGKEVKISNGKMYSTLRTTGINSVVKWVDEQILGNLVKDGSTSSYLALAKADEAKINEVKKEAIYGELTDEEIAELSDDEKAKHEESYLENLKSIGIKGDIATLTEAEKDYFAVICAREAYAYDKLVSEIKAQDEKAASDEDEDYYFTDSRIESYYNSSEDNKDGYWAIVVPFSSQQLFNAALAQLGVKVDVDNSNIWKKGDAALTASEVLSTFVKLYNTNVAKAEVVDPSQFVSANVTTDGKFDATKAESYKEEFYYTYDELNAVNSSLRNRIASSGLANFFENAADASGKDVTGFTKTTLSYSGVYYAVLKICVVEATDFETYEKDGKVDRSDDVIKNIISELTEEAVTDSYISEKMADLRSEYGIRFYDDALQAAYQRSIDADLKAYKKESKTDVCYIEKLNVKLSADDYFKLLVKQSASGYLTDLINREIVLLDKEYNKVVPNYTSGMSYKEMKKDAAKNGDGETFTDILANIQSLKSNFAGNAFSSYGYPATYGWINFIKDFYRQNYGVSIESEEELVTYMVYQDTVSNMVEDLNKSSEYSATSELWAKLEAAMKKQASEYFAVKGYHLLISVSKDGKIVDPKDWTAAQISAAEELYDEVIAKLFVDGTVFENRSSVLESFVTAYNNAPVYSLYGVDGNKLTDAQLADPTNQLGYEMDEVTEGALKDRPYVFTGDNKYISGIEINLSKYKSLGLEVKYESLTGSDGKDFGPGVMVEPFEKVAKHLWDVTEKSYDDSANSWVQDDAVKLATKAMVKAATNDSEEYLVSEFGYHVYVQTSYTGVSGVDSVIDSEATGEVKGEYKEYRVPTLEEIVTYLDIINSDEYKEILESENYKSGDEERAFVSEWDEDKAVAYKLTPWQRGNISTYYGAAENELKGSYAMSIKLISSLLDNRASLTINSAELNSEVEAGVSLIDYVIKMQLEYAADQLTTTKSYFADVLAKYGITVEVE